jgi:hypothetical protein
MCTHLWIYIGSLPTAEAIAPCSRVYSKTHLWIYIHSPGRCGKNAMFQGSIVKHVYGSIPIPLVAEAQGQFSWVYSKTHLWIYTDSPESIPTPLVAEAQVQFSRVYSKTHLCIYIEPYTRKPFNTAKRERCRGLDKNPPCPSRRSYLNHYKRD